MNKEIFPPEWKFWVFSFNGEHMITTYGLSEEEARENLQVVANQNPDVGLIVDQCVLLFNVDSPVDIDRIDDEMLKALCVLVTHTIVKNDACNRSFRNVIAGSDSGVVKQDDDFINMRQVLDNPNP